MELDGSIEVAWEAGGFQLIRVRAPGRSREALQEFASGVADEALLNRSAAALRTALRARFGATIELELRDRRASGGVPHVLVTLRPPRGTPNPDPFP